MFWVVVCMNAPRSHRVLTMGSLRIIRPIVAGIVMNRINRILKLNVFTKFFKSPFAAWLERVGRRAIGNAVANTPNGSCTN